MRQIIVFLIALITTFSFAQQKVVYNSKAFKNSEVVKATIGNRGETMSFEISEHDMSPKGSWAKEVRRLESLGKIADPSKAPKGLSLILSVDFKRKFPFPIKPTDSIVIRMSDLKSNLLERSHQNKELAKVDDKGAKNEAKSLHSQKINIEAESRKIAKLMQQGKISPNEAMKRIEKLTKPILQQVDNSKNINQKVKEYKEPSIYGITFSNTITNNEAKIVTGNLHIVEFTKNKLVAYISGEHIVECADVVRKNTTKKDCKKVASKHIPGHKVYKEEQVYLIINSTFNEFFDDRN